MKIHKDKQMSNYTTFKTGGLVGSFCSVSTKKDLEEAIKYSTGNSLSVKILGAGSNILVSDEKLNDLVIKMEILGKNIGKNIQTNEDKDDPFDEYALVTAYAGENWDDFIVWTLDNSLYGLENLSAIPGTVGAAPIQNIGAYGVEIAQSIHSVEICRIENGQVVFTIIPAKDCKFGYRDSIFKHEPHSGDIVISVTFKLNRKPKVNAEYKDVKNWLEKNKPNIPHDQITPELVRRAVIDIRQTKLPDLLKVGTAGSFFKNPVISSEHFARLKAKYPELPGFPSSQNSGTGDSSVKIPLAWVLDNICHVKNLCVGDACVYEKQPLVIVNRENASSAEIKELARILTKKVFEATGITIGPEVVIWD